MLKDCLIDFVDYCRYSCRDIKYKLKNFLFPRQKWLTKKIPNHWVDKQTLWETCILEGIKHFVSVDGEDCFNVLELENCHDVQKIFMQEVRTNYNLITQKLPELEKQLDVEWSKIIATPIDLDRINNQTPESYEKTYGEVNRLEKEISDLKTQIMVWAVQNREKIWT